MLTQDQKNQILLEERYRREVQLKLDKPKRRSLWEFVNSAFGMWLLTTVVVSWGLELNAARMRDVERQNKLDRLHLEIGYRFTQVQETLANAETGDLETRERAVAEALSRLRRAGDKSSTVSGFTAYLSLYPEYQGFGLPALLAEQKKLRKMTVPEEKETNKILGHLAALRSFIRIKNISQGDPKQVAGAIIDEIVPERVKVKEEKTYWYYLDGRKENPFP